MNKKVVVYVHGKGGTALEAEHYRPLFGGYDIVSVDYLGNVPWEIAAEIEKTIEYVKGKYESIVLIASSIGAYYSMLARIDGALNKAYFISPIVDMEGLIRDMMFRSNVTEEQLRTERIIPTRFGEDLSWEYFTFVRTHPICWRVHTEVLYGAKDDLISFATISAFAETCGAKVTVMPEGEHWFHTEEQMRFLDRWILEKA